MWGGVTYLGGEGELEVRLGVERVLELLCDDRELIA